MIIGIVIALFVIIVLPAVLFGWKHTELPKKRAGRMGETFATTVIKEILTDRDVLLTNVELKVGDRQTELDNAVINTNGIFIIEVKNINGQLVGYEAESEWIVNEMTPAGKLYQKRVRNPIRQVKRQEELVSKLMEENGIKVPVKGFVFFVMRNAPVKSAYILETQQDMDLAIHSEPEDYPDDETVRRIAEVLMGEQIQ